MEDKEFGEVTSSSVARAPPAALMAALPPAQRGVLHSRPPCCRPRPQRGATSGGPSIAVRSNVAAGARREGALMSQMVPLEIESIAAGGDGVARSNGLVVFVPRTAPGELVTARISGKGSFARGTLRKITRPSEERIDPPCPHYTRDRCGGCQIQHMSYASQLRAKQRIVRDAMERIGKRRVTIRQVQDSP